MCWVAWAHRSITLWWWLCSKTWSQIGYRKKGGRWFWAARWGSTHQIWWRRGWKHWYDSDGCRSHPRAEHLKILFLSNKRLWQALGQGPAVRNMISQTKLTTRLTHPNHSQLGWRQWQQVSWRVVWSLLSRRGFSLVPSRVAGDDPCVWLPKEGNIKHSTSSLWPSTIHSYMWLEKGCYSAPSSGVNNRTVSSGNVVQGHFPLLESCLLLPQLLPWAHSFG